MAKALAYCSVELITAVKSFMIRVPARGSTLVRTSLNHKHYTRVELSESGKTL
jgi:hypothetical protein